MLLCFFFPFCCFNPKMSPLPLFLAYSLTFRFQLPLLQFQDLLRFRIQLCILHLFPHFTLYLFETAPNFFYISSFDQTTYRLYKRFFLTLYFYPYFYILPHKHLFSHKNMAIRLSLRIATQLQIYFFLTNSSFTPNINKNPPSKIKEIHITFQYGA